MKRIVQVILFIILLLSTYTIYSIDEWYCPDSPSGQHYYGTETISSEHTSNGHLASKECKECGYVSTRYVSMNACCECVGHVYTPISYGEHTSQGHAIILRCGRCGDEIIDGYIELDSCCLCTGHHNYGDWSTPSSVHTSNGHYTYRQCIECGEIESKYVASSECCQCVGHNYEVISVGEHESRGHAVTKRCTRCGDTIISEYIYDNTCCMCTGNHSYTSWSIPSSYHSIYGHYQYRTCTSCSHKDIRYVEDSDCCECNNHNYLLYGTSDLHTSLGHEILYICSRCNNIVGMGEYIKLNSCELCYPTILEEKENYYTDGTYIEDIGLYLNMYVNDYYSIESYGVPYGEFYVSLQGLMTKDGIKGEYQYLGYNSQGNNITNDYYHVSSSHVFTGDYIYIKYNSSAIWNTANIATITSFWNNNVYEDDIKEYILNVSFYDDDHDENGGGRSLNDLTTDLSKIEVLTIPTKTTQGSVRLYWSAYSVGSDVKNDYNTVIIPSFDESGYSVTRYRIDYDSNGASEGYAPASSEFVENDIVYILGNIGELKLDDYEFDCWNSKADGSGLDYLVGYAFNISKDITLYAKWKEHVITSSITTPIVTTMATTTISTTAATSTKWNWFFTWPITTTATTTSPNFGIDSVIIYGSWNYFDQEHRFLSLERIYIYIKTFGEPERVIVSMSNELESMTYTNDLGHVYSYNSDFFGYNINFPVVIENDDSINDFSFEYNLPLCDETIDFEDIRTKAAYYIKIEVENNSVKYEYIIEDIDITGNVYDLIYPQPIY